MKKMNKNRRIRLITFLTVVIAIGLAILYLWLSGYSGAWFTQEETASAVYDMGVVKIDGVDNFQFTLKNLNFPASTLMRGDAANDDVNFNSCVYMAKGVISNKSTVPIKLSFAVENAIVSDSDPKNAKKNPGLMYSLFYCKKDSTDPADVAAKALLNVPNKDVPQYKEYFGCTVDAAGKLAKGLDTAKFKVVLPAISSDGKADLASTVRLPEANYQMKDIVLEVPTDGTAVEYEMYWIFWVDHLRAIEATPALQSNTYVPQSNDYGVNISIAARQIDAP